MLRSTLATEHELLNAQLQELAGLRQELQGLYEKTQAELQVTKSEAALERGLREAATTYLPSGVTHAELTHLGGERLQIGDEMAKMLASGRQQRIQTRRRRSQQRRHFSGFLGERCALGGVSIDAVFDAKIAHVIVTIGEIVFEEFSMMLGQTVGYRAIVDGNEFCARIREAIVSVNAVIAILKFFRLPFRFLFGDGGGGIRSGVHFNL